MVAQGAIRSMELVGFQNFPDLHIHHPETVCIGICVLH